MVTLLAVIIGVLSLLSAIVCSKCSETYDGRAKHVCATTGTKKETDDAPAWFDTVQTALSGLLALDWAKNGTVIERAVRVTRMTLGEASKVYDIPEWKKVDVPTAKGKKPIPWQERFCLMIEQGKDAAGSLNDVFVHQNTLMKSVAEFLKVMNDAGHVVMEESGSVYLKVDAKLIFVRHESSGRQYYEATFEL